MRFLRRAVPLLAALLTVPALGGCTSLPFLSGETLYVMVARQRRLLWIKRTDLQEQLGEPLQKEFSRLNPNVRVSVLTVDEDELAEQLRLRTARGLGPDLLLVRAPVANTLLEDGLISPVPRPSSMDATIDQVDPVVLRRVRNGSVLSGVPFNEQVSLACYNRSTMPTPPRTTKELLASAAAGRTIGLSIDGYGIWWTAGTEGAANAIVPLLLGQVPVDPAASRSAEQRIAAWLSWLRQLAGQSRVDMASGPQELTQGLISGRLDWIPCFSLTVDILRQAMGDRLGVAALPSGPGGNPSPFNTLNVWAFGLNSSARQRQNALDLVQLSLDPVMQRRLVLESQEVLPVNRYVETPVASSGVLAALEEARQQFKTVSLLFTQPFDLRRLNFLLPQMEAVIQQVMVGILSPDEGARRILRFAPPPR